MKMPRSQCEVRNVQFVQELAEVDGPFEAPININFRDLTKLELPALVWNRSDACPRKMKITNTGHTVIVSAKWKSERPYLTGGPLTGKYVFSQIHFHWGQTDCRGSEHQICGEEFPLEMHVAHFKTEYMTQESALREKDGMVVVVYLFKLQEEPNHSLKRIINSLPRVRQPSTSYAIDPRPIVSLCNPFTEDYFMYWGSVVTSTCAHILLWIICREPFGISKEQVCEFRKIMDSCQQPICKNSRDVQPLHKRNVFHVNASKHLDDPLLPIRKRLGCYCKESKDAFSNSNSCHCQGAYQNQEDVEGNVPERAAFEGVKTEHGCFGNQTFVVQRATMRSVIVLKRTGSDPIKNQSSVIKVKRVKSEVCNEQVKLGSKSCCFFPSTETKKINNLSEKRKPREKSKLFNSAKAFSQIMNSLETLKNQTFKKLKKIESINQEIKDMKPFCQDLEDKRWIRKIEKLILKQKKFTVKSSQGCLSELKKLAKDCNFDKYFDSKAFPSNTNGRKIMWLGNSMMPTRELPCFDTLNENEEIHGIENQLSKHSDVGKTMRFSSQAQELIESFFEDIRDNEDLQETVTNDPNYKKIKSLCSVAGDSKSVSAKNRGYITQKMFNLGNLGDRFFAEVTTEDMDLDENWKCEEQREELTTAQNAFETINIPKECETGKFVEQKDENISKNEGLIPLHRVNIPISFVKVKEEENEFLATVTIQEGSLEDEKNQKLSQKKANKQIHIKKPVDGSEEKSHEMSDENLIKAHEKNATPSKSSSLNLSADSIKTHRIATKKVRKYRKGFSEQGKRKSSGLLKIPSKKLYCKTSSKKFENVNTHLRNLKNKEQKSPVDENIKHQNLSGRSSSNTEKVNEVLNQSPHERKIKTKLKCETDKYINTTEEVLKENSLICLEEKKLTARPSKEETVVSENKSIRVTTAETETLTADPLAKYHKIESGKVKEKDTKEDESKPKILKKEEQQSLIVGRNESENVGKTYRSKTYRASLVDSKNSESKIGEQKGFGDNPSEQNTALMVEVSKLSEEKPFAKTNCRSLTDLSIRPKAELAQRLQLESVDSRKKINQETFVKKLKESYRGVKKSSGEVLSETPKNPIDQEQKEFGSPEKCKKSQNRFEYGNGFSTVSSTQDSDDFPPKAQTQDEKEKLIERKGSFVSKNQLTERGSEETYEVLRSRDSEKCFAKNAFIGDAQFSATDNKNFQTSLSCLTLKKNSTSRPHSAETLHSLKTNQKRKSKKRPHCIKRKSRHYIRKNHSVLRKPSKPFHFLSLADEEQLKILSVNVAKYIQQKLMDEKSHSEIKKSSPIDVEKELRNLSVPEKKSEESPKQGSGAVHLQKRKKFRIPVLKSIERTKMREKDIETLKKPNTAESQIETVRKKPELYSSPRPVSNFIQLNKQMAGTYRRAAPTTLKNNTSADKEKSNLRTKPVEKTLKPKIKTQKKTKEKLSVQKPKELQVLPPAVQIPSPKAPVRKDQQVKGSISPKKPDSKPKAVLTKAQASSPKPEKSNEDEGVKCKTESSTKETPRSNKGSTSTAPETTQVPDEKNNQPSVTELDSKCNAEDKIQNEAQFKKELEYFITMQMYLNNEFSKSKETLLPFLSSKPPNSDEKAAASPLTYDSFKNLDFSGKDLVIVKRRNLEDCSSSCSELTEHPVKFIPQKGEDDEKIEDRFEKKNLPKKPSKECQSNTAKNSPPVREPPEDVPSDSSYDCKISITLNTKINSKEMDSESDRQGYETYCLEENSKSQMITSEGSSSQLTEIKPDNEKKESEMSLEMKQKLLEILEGEIKREIGISCTVSPGNSSGGLGYKTGDSEGNLGSQSIGSSSSSGNMEALASISNSMREYLSYLSWLPDDGKDYEEFLLEKGDETF